MDLIRSLTWVSAAHLRLVRDDDSHIDRLSHRYTVAICLLFSIIVTTKQYAGDPIDCWVPAQFKASYEKYADSYCWIAGSWYTPMDKELPLNERERRQHRIRYYQWVPFLLLFQAILCYIPRIVWRTLNVKSGLDIVNLVDAALKYESVDKFGDRDKIMAYIIRNVERYIGARKSRYERLYGRRFCITHKNTNLKTQQQQINKSKQNSGSASRRPNTTLSSCLRGCCLKIRIVLSTICFWTGKRLGNYLVVLYMFVKTLWLTNAVSQLFLLNSFIGNNYHAFGIEIIQMLLSGQEWHELRHFPRVTYCDFKIREIGNSHDWTVQCVLRINLFNEVIYIFMWFWLCILAFFSAIDYLTWAFRIFIPGDKLRFVKRHLDIYNNDMSTINLNKKIFKGGDPQHQMSNEELQANIELMDIEKEKKLMKEFTFNYLKDDGVFAMRILASSASDLIVTEIISELWKNFKMNYLAEQQLEELTCLSSSPSSANSNSSLEATTVGPQVSAPPLSSAFSSPTASQNNAFKKLATSSNNSLNIMNNNANTKKPFHMQNTSYSSAATAYNNYNLKHNNQQHQEHYSNLNQQKINNSSLAQSSSSSNFQQIATNSTNLLTSVQSAPTNKNTPSFNNNSNIINNNNNNNNSVPSTITSNNNNNSSNINQDENISISQSIRKLSNTPIQANNLVTSQQYQRSALQLENLNSSSCAANPNAKDTHV